MARVCHRCWCRAIRRAEHVIGVRRFAGIRRTFNAAIRDINGLRDSVTEVPDPLAILDGVRRHFARWWCALGQCKSWEALNHSKDAKGHEQNQA